MSKKTDEYYMALPYTKEVRRLLPHEGGGYVATIPLLGRKTFVADGETEVEAMESLNRLSRILFRDFAQGGYILPEPVIE